MPLNEMKIRNAKPKEKFYKIADGDGLYLHVAETGGKLWRFRYRFAGKEKLLALGSYPEISLLDARQRRDEARRQLAHSVDPGAVRKALKQAKTEETETFEVIAREWHNKRMHTLKESHSSRVLSRLEKNVFPHLGPRPITQIKAPELLSVLRRLEARGILHTAHTIRGICGQIFRYAVATGRAEHDPSADLRGALASAKTINRAAITDPVRVGELLRAIDCYRGSFIVQCALKLAPLTFVRPGELRHGEWIEMDLEKAEWNIPGKKMKTGQPHLVPLSKQAVNVLIELKKLTGAGRYVLPGRTSNRPMSDNAILAALRNMGYAKEEMSGHGFRAMARTILDEVLQVRPDLIEHQLAHAVRDPLGRAYNRTQHLEDRRRMMQTWADYLDGLRAGAKVIPFKKGGVL